MTDAYLKFQPPFYPSYLLRTKWVEADRLGDFKDVAQGILEKAQRDAGWNPKVTHLKGNLYIVDVCSLPGPEAVLHSAKLAYLRDHRRLKEFPPNTPKSVTNLYKKSVRLAEHQAMDWYANWGARDRAERAWSRFLASSS